MDRNLPNAKANRRKKKTEQTEQKSENYETTTKGVTPHHGMTRKRREEGAEGTT